MIEYTLMNVLILELKIYCGPDKFYGRSKFGHYDEVKDRAPLHKIIFNIFLFKVIPKFYTLVLHVLGKVLGISRGRFGVFKYNTFCLLTRI